MKIRAGLKRAGRFFDRLAGIRRTKVISGMHYTTVTPVASYAPWLDDLKFRKIYNTVRNNTLVDEYRCFELWDLVAQTAPLKGDVLEVGVWKGGTGTLLAARTAMLAPEKRVYLCDTFQGVVKVTSADSSYSGGEHSETSEGLVRQLLTSCGVENADILVGIFPEDTSHLIPDPHFSLIHIDVDIYQSAKDIMNYAWPKLARGGMVVFDDYGFSTCDGIAKLVNEYRGLEDRVVIHNLNGHAVIVKTQP